MLSVVTARSIPRAQSTAMLGDRATPANEVGHAVEGTLLAGKYRIDRIIGRGGMGLVVAATHVGLGERVAIKVLHRASAKNPEMAERLMREARASVRLRSPHVVRVRDVGHTDDDAAFMVMEHLDGCDLATRLEREGALPIPLAVECILQTCHAIAEAHAIGIIHRDLKPANLFLVDRPDGAPFVKVLDFGISKFRRETIMRGARLTAKTDMMGSPGFMSPEQVASTRDADERSDIWALGATLYELLANESAFNPRGVNDLLVMMETRDAPRITAIRPAVPAWLEAIVARCLERRPEQRFQSIGALVKALRRGAAPSPRPLVSSTLTWTAIPCAALVAIALAFAVPLDVTNWTAFRATPSLADAAMRSESTSIIEVEAPTSSASMHSRAPHATRGHGSIAGLQSVDDEFGGRR